MKKNKKKNGLKTLLAGSLYLALMIPLFAAPGRPYDPEKDMESVKMMPDGSGPGGGPSDYSSTCYYPSRNSNRMWDPINDQWVYIQEYFFGCNPCHTIVYGTPGDYGVCSL